jgi:hypothetical protein
MQMKSSSNVVGRKIVKPPILLYAVTHKEADDEGGINRKTQFSPDVIV